MRDCDEVEFVKVINAMAAMKKQTLTPDVIELWWLLFAGWEIDEFKSAARHLLRTKTFMPQPNEFEDLRRAGRETAGEVFAGIRQWFTYTPNGYTLRADTPRAIASSIAAMGGPNAYAMCDEQKLPFLERRFCEHYEQITGANDTREAVAEIAYGEMTPKLSRAAGSFKSLVKVT